MAGEEIVQGEIGIGRQRDAPDRQAACAGEHAGQRIAEIAGGHDEIQQFVATVQVLRGARGRSKSFAAAGGRD